MNCSKLYCDGHGHGYSKFGQVQLAKGGHRPLATPLTIKRSCACGVRYLVKKNAVHLQHSKYTQGSWQQTIPAVVDQVVFN